MATTDKRLDVSDLDFDDIKTNLKTFMRNQSEFTDYDFEGSGINALLDVLAYNTHYLGMNMNMVANESFLDTASIRSSVVSHAKTLGYIPNSARAPIANIRITLNNPTAINTAVIPVGTIFTTQIDDINYQFVTVSEHTQNKVNGVIIARDDLHYPISKFFLKKKIPVFIDKPLTSKSKELDFYKKYLKNGLLMSTSGLRFSKEVDFLKKKIKKLGKIKSINALVVNDFYAQS